MMGFYSCLSCTKSCIRAHQAKRQTWGVAGGLRFSRLPPIKTHPPKGGWFSGSERSCLFSSKNPALETGNFKHAEILGEVIGCSFPAKAMNRHLQELIGCCLLKTEVSILKSVAKAVLDFGASPTKSLN